MSVARPPQTLRCTSPHRTPRLSLGHRRDADIRDPPEVRAGDDLLQPVAKATQAEIMREPEACTQPHAGWIGIELPWMDGQHGWDATTIGGLHRPKHPARSAHPESPSPAHWH